METSASWLCAKRGWAACSGNADLSHQAPSYSANRVQRVSLEEQKGRAAHGTLQIRYCWKFSVGYTAKHHKKTDVGEKVPTTAHFKNKTETHSSYLIPRDSPLSVLRVPAPCPYP